MITKLLFWFNKLFSKHVFKRLLEKSQGMISYDLNVIIIIIIIMDLASMQGMGICP